jgi:hypothetical protein
MLREGSGGTWPNRGPLFRKGYPSLVEKQTPGVLLHLVMGEEMDYNAIDPAHRWMEEENEGVYRR